jgi:hypothetical protein
MSILDQRLEIASAVVLSLAALASTWAGYQASLWDGEQAAAYSRSDALRIRASAVRLEGDARQAEHRSAFVEWLNARAEGAALRSRFYEERFPPAMRPAFNAWVRERPMTNPSAPPSPFLTPAYEWPGRKAAGELETLAEATFSAGQRANRISDAFGQSSAILATALFFGGIGQAFKLRSAKVGLLAIAIAATVLGLLRMLGLPLQVLGLTPVT